MPKKDTPTNILSVTHPELVKEWDYDDNAPLTPDEVKYGSGKIVWWKCAKGHKWQASINTRTNTKSGCPYCSGRRAISGVNDISTTNPELLKLWNYPKNQSLKLSEISAGSNIKVWWICNKGHEWEAKISDVSQGTRCPYCSGHKVLSGFNDLATLRPDIASEWNYDKNAYAKNE